MFEICLDAEHGIGFVMHKNSIIEHGINKGKKPPDIIRKIKKTLWIQVINAIKSFISSDKLI